MLQLIFWLSLIGSAFSYFLYPLILSVIPARRSTSTINTTNTALPRVSLIVTAHNEESRIREKIQNCLTLNYPDLEILIASDASSDSTDQIVNEYHEQGVRLARADVRKGKEYAQLQAITQATGDILVFSDVATSIPEDAIGRMVRYFEDTAVGAVSSEDRFISRDGSIVGEGAYVRYEMWLRGLESKKAGLVGLSGSFFAARRSVCDDWDILSPSDFNTALNCARCGLVAVTAADVLGYYKDVADAGKEYQRKVRTIIRGLTALSRHLEVLNPSTFGLFSFQVFGHKLMRWAVPWFQVLLLASSLLLAGKGGFYTLVLAAQAVFYGLALSGHISPRLRAYAPVKIPYFFIQVNLAVAHAFVSFLSGKRMTVWAPSQR
ncbi:glycosyltransferase [Marinobacter sp.]|uniref:glycosyltransferase n=1 Tax=Marinobacter sp. TaxID=50741 RepID=UPI0034A5ACD9